MHRNPLAMLAAIVLAGSLLAGCTASAEPSSAAIYVKDAPSDEVQNLDVTFGQVAIHRASDREHDEDDDEQDDDEDSAGNGTGHVSVSVEVEDKDEHKSDSGWIVLSNKTTTVDLKALDGNKSAFLAGADVPAGRYNQIRLTILAAKATLDNGTVVNVTVPSGVLRLQAHFTVRAGNETALTLDFDLEHALVKTGDGHYILKPVLHMDGEHRRHLRHAEWRERERMRDEWSERRERHGDDDHERDD